jgi:antitoxin CptB
MYSEIPPRLRWACRRGMLELDIMLGRFLERSFLSLAAHEQELFIKLLSCEDQDLFEWLTGKKTPSNDDIKYIINLIKTAKHA